MSLEGMLLNGTGGGRKNEKRRGYATTLAPNLDITLETIGLPMDLVEIKLTRISDLTLICWKPRECVERPYWCGFERDDDAVEVHTQWVRHQTGPFSSRSTPR